LFFFNFSPGFRDKVFDCLMTISLLRKILTSGKYSEAQAIMRKYPVSIALSNRVLEKIDNEASKQTRSRSEYVELHFETIFFPESGKRKKGLGFFVPSID
jgi:hypothetical protein